MSRISTGRSSSRSGRFVAQAAITKLSGFDDVEEAKTRLDLYRFKVTTTSLR